jgi:hypothetical protein
MKQALNGPALFCAWLGPLGALDGIVQRAVLALQMQCAKTEEDVKVSLHTLQEKARRESAWTGELSFQLGPDLTDILQMAMTREQKGNIAQNIVL